MIKKVILLMLITVMLSGCGAKIANTNSGQVTKTGVIKMKTGEEYIMQVGQDMVNVASQKINLDDYLKKEVEIKGMYSGSTLYADEVREK